MLLLDAINWILSIAAQKPTDFGYAAETWSYNQLAKHIREHCLQYGHSTLLKLGKGKLHTINWLMNSTQNIGRYD